jgi:hypothetical protein
MEGAHKRRRWIHSDRRVARSSPLTDRKRDFSKSKGGRWLVTRERSGVPPKGRDEIVDVELDATRDESFDERVPSRVDLLVPSAKDRTLPIVRPQESLKDQEVDRALDESAERTRPGRADDRRA